MRVTAPDAEGRPHTYQYNHDDLTIAEGDLLELQAGIGYLEFATPDLRKFRTWRAIIWLCRMRDGEKQLQYTDVNAKFTDITFEPDAEAVEEKKAETRSVSKPARTLTTNGHKEPSVSVARTG